MGENTHIQWTDHTFNPWEGCTKVSPGCLHCYAETRNKRFSGGANWGKGAPRRRTSVSNRNLPLKWNRDATLARHQPCGCVVCVCDDDVQCQGCGAKNCGSHEPGKLPNPVYNRPRVFCASLADWLDDEVPIEWLADLLDLIRKTPNLDWQLLTKRPENWGARIEGVLKWIEVIPDWDAPGEHRLEQLRNWLADWFVLRKPPANIWIGTTVEDQQRADERIPLLQKIPTKVRFLSCEPLLGSVNLKHGFFKNIPISEVPGSALDDGAYACREFLAPLNAIHWVICGGESGPGARPMNPDWARSLRDQCAAAGKPFFFKQWGEWVRDPDISHAAIMAGVDAESCIVPYGDGDERNFRRVYRVGKIRAGRKLDGIEHNAFPQ